MFGRQLPRVVHSMSNRYMLFQTSYFSIQRERVPFDRAIPDCAITTDKVHKNVMVVGGTGTGKTTSINSWMNYLFNTKVEDNRKYLIEEDEKPKGQAESQTDDVTPYYIEPTAIDYSITLWDTPGFADTRNCDEEHMNKLKKCFEQQLDTMDAIIFVIRSSDVRLNDALKYIFDQVLSIFGKDIEDNIFILFTWCDSGTPVALNALTEDKVPYKDYFCINNNSFTEEEKECDSKRERETKAKMVQKKANWDISMIALEYLFDAIKETEPKSLTLTSNVLKERAQLKNYLCQIPKLIGHVLDLMANLDENRAIIQQEEATMESNEVYKYLDENQAIIQQGEATMESNKAYKFKRAYTHKELVYSSNWYCVNDEIKSTCSRYIEWFKLTPFMCDNFLWNGYCTICGESVSKHNLRKYCYDVETRYEYITKQELYSRYTDALNKKNATEEVLKGLKKDYEKKRNDLYEDVNNLTRCINRLSKIALRQNIKEPTDYIDMFIKQERDRKGVGYEDRIKILDDLKLYMQTTQRHFVKDDEDNSFLKGASKVASNVYERASKVASNVYEDWIMNEDQDSSQ